jgi:predicted nucleic acid-binding protein
MNGSGFLLDTNTVIELLKGVPEAKALHDSRLIGGNLFVSQVTRMEILSFPGIQPDEEQRVLAFLSRVEVLPISDDIETSAISLRRQRRLKLPDAIILATAACHGITLVTRDDVLTRKASGVVPCLTPAKR